MRKSTKKRITTAVVTLVLLGGGVGGAIAYWTASGTGTGSATTGTSLAVNATQTGSITNLRPGGTAQNITGVFDNLNDAPTYVSTVTIAISSVTGGTGGCAAGDYTLVNPVLTINAVVDDGDVFGTDVDGPATIVFFEDGTNQDNCKNATVNLSFTVA